MFKLTHCNFKDYDEFENDNEEHFFVNRATGECVPGACVQENGCKRWFPGGGKYVTPKQLNAWEAYNERTQAQSEQAKILGPFIYAIATYDAFRDLPADTLARAAYLASYLRFGTNELWVTKRSQMRRADLPEVLQMGKSATAEFWGSVNNKYFYRDKDGFLHTLGRNFVKGELKSAPWIEYQKLYQSSIRELYQKIPPKQHKRLGFALKMLPYLNFEYNVLSYNPAETNRDSIIPLTVEGFCEIVGFDKSRASDLAKEYGRLTFTVDNMQEVFCKFLNNGEGNATAHIYINPRLLYKGTDFRRVAAIGISFAASAKSTH